MQLPHQLLTAQQLLRIEVARDVIAATKATENSLKVKSGYGYIRSVDTNKGELDHIDSKVTAKRLMETCTVCAQGALLLCLVAKNNDFSFWNANNDLDCVNIRHEPIMQRLSQVWDTTQLDMIEIAFETSHEAAYGRRSYTRVVARRAAAFGAKHSYDVNRLHAIMKNIIENNGEFIP